MKASASSKPVQLEKKKLVKVDSDVEDLLSDSEDEGVVAQEPAAKKVKVDGDPKAN